MTRCAADLGEDLFAQQHRALYRGIIRYDSTRHLQSCLINRNCCDVSARHFIYDAIPIPVCIDTEPFRGLNAVVLIEGSVCEFAQ